jgi:hypothetical protein
MGLSNRERNWSYLGAREENRDETREKRDEK